MSETISIQASVRSGLGTGVARSIRREGNVPAVIYGKDRDTIHLALPQADAVALHENSFRGIKLVELTLDGKKHVALPKQFGVHPVSGLVEHVEFVFADHSGRLKMRVPVKLIGKDKSPGVKKGGIINLVYKFLQCSVFKDSILPSIEIDVSAMEVGAHMALRDLKLPVDVKLIISNLDLTLLRLTGKRSLIESLEIKQPEAGESGAEGAAAAGSAEKGSVKDKKPKTDKDDKKPKQEKKPEKK